jgi:hypothetical protein
LLLLLYMPSAPLFITTKDPAPSVARSRQSTAA